MEDSSSSQPSKEEIAGAGAERLSSAVAPKEEMEEQHKELALEMFQKIAEYLNGELAGEPP